MVRVREIFAYTSRKEISKSYRYNSHCPCCAQAPGFGLAVKITGHPEVQQQHILILIIYQSIYHLIYNAWVLKLACKRQSNNFSNELSLEFPTLKLWNFSQFCGSYAGLSCQGSRAAYFDESNLFFGGYSDGVSPLKLLAKPAKMSVKLKRNRAKSYKTKSLYLYINWGYAGAGIDKSEFQLSLDAKI